MSQATRDQTVLRSAGSIKADLTANTAITLNVTPAMMSMLRQIAVDSHQPLEVVFTRAIALYRAVLDAEAEGKHVGYAGTPDGLEVEFTGITGGGSD